MLRNILIYIMFMRYDLQVVFAFSQDLKYCNVGLPDEICIYFKSTLSMLIDFYRNTATKKIFY